MVEYKLEGYNLFLEMMASIRRNTIYNVYMFQPAKVRAACHLSAYIWLQMLTHSQTHAFVLVQIVTTLSALHLITSTPLTANCNCKESTLSSNTNGSIFHVFVACSPPLVSQHFNGISRSFLLTFLPPSPCCVYAATASVRLALLSPYHWQPLCLCLCSLWSLLMHRLMRSKNG